MPPPVPLSWLEGAVGDKKTEERDIQQRHSRRTCGRNNSMDTRGSAPEERDEKKANGL